MKKVAATDVTSMVELDRGKITLTGLQGQTLDGTHRGDWLIDASSQPLRYQCKGTLQGVSLAQASALTSDAWVTGTADGKYDLASTGNTIADLVAHAEGDLQFSMQNGTLKNIELSGGVKPFPVHRFSGHLKMKKGGWELRAGKLESRDGIYQVSGSASPSGILDLVLVRGDEQKWNVTGTLAKPRVAPGNRTEARTAVKP
jgi:AsmA family